MVNNLFTLPFSKISKKDIPTVGGKGANLGEMTNAGFPVPPGFAVTVAAYDRFLEHGSLVSKIKKIIESIDVKDSNDLQKKASSIQKLIIKSEIPDDVAHESIRSYQKLTKGIKTLVAIRSSATAEDLPNASFAGQQASFLNVKGEANLLVKVRECWASLFTARAIFYRAENKIKEDQVKISVIVQEMVQSEVSGVMFSIDPVTNDKERIVIEAVWGLGEMIVQGSVVPDKYVVQKDTFFILSKEISDQSVQLIKVDGNTKETEVPKNKINLQKITDVQIVTLAKIAQKLQEHYYFPQDVEWAKDVKGSLFITQTRPVTTLEDKRRRVKDEGIKLANTPILTGTPASPGIATGHVQIIRSAKEISKVGEGDILVAVMTMPDFVPAMKKAGAIVTNEGGLTSHAAIVSRELGVPCVVGTKEATKKLKTGQVITVDAGKGEVYLGANVRIEKNATQIKKIIDSKYSHRKTKTKLYVNLAEVDRIEEIAKKNVEGIGLLRAEFMIANIGIHPKQAIKEKKQKLFIDKLERDLTKFCKSFENRPVVYRATDFKTNEYRALQGGKAWEPEESNPMLGFRGAFRYIAHPDVFNLELIAIKNVRKKHKNLMLMIPFVRSPEELARVRRLVAAEGLFSDSTFKFWMMVEIPVNVILINKFIDVGIDGVSIGSNDLTMLITGTDRDNSNVAGQFNEKSPAVYWALRRVVKACKKRGVTSSICGQAPSYYEDLVEKLVNLGITSISVNPDAINRVRAVIYETEKTL